MASWETGQVLDVEVLSKWCNQCQEKKECPDTSLAQFFGLVGGASEFVWPELYWIIWCDGEGGCIDDMEEVN